MNTVQERTYWNNIDENYKNYPKLTSNTDCDVVVVGGGISGALTTYYLSQYKLNTVLIEKSKIGQGSTLLSSGILKPYFDKSINDLSKLIGENHAERAFKLCLKSIDDIENILSNIHKDCGFEKTKDSHALLDPFRFCHAILKTAASKGALIYENTSLLSFDYAPDKIRVNAGDFHITCKKIVFTAGQSALKLIKDEIVKYRPSVTIVTNKLDKVDGAAQKCMCFKPNDLYYNIRVAYGNRILAQAYGTDDEQSLTASRIIDDLKSMFPDIKNITADYIWKCSYPETKDSLPYIGTYTSLPNCYFNLGLGGNGETLAAYGAQIIKDLILYESNPDAEIFSFNR
ncbi:FAD dependent oxidoreductase [Clostridiales bacterium oral taxon 876 str. F0540]|nr:FAD dependent oxidoreductase [Clostridiales bacterium oral taxon 876 str. F0540]